MSNVVSTTVRKEQPKQKRVPITYELSPCGDM